MKVSEYIAEFLVEKGIKDVFLIDGSACASLIVAIARNKKLRYYCPLHEQAGAFAVDGYFKASGNIGVMVATSGPAGQNLLNGIAASYYDSCSALYITGQINSRFIKPTNKIRQHGFQENDIVSMAKPITKYAVMLKHPNEVRTRLEMAYRLAIMGRPGPVLVDIPMDIQKAEMPESSIDDIKFFYKKENRIPFEIRTDYLDKTRKCWHLMKKSKRPAILLGGGVWLAGAVNDAKMLANRLKTVPFFVTWNMIDYFDPIHFGGKVGTFGGSGRNFGIQNCDFLLAIGSRISGRITGAMMDSFARGAKKVIVDIDENELKYQQVKADLNICCDAKIFIQKFLTLVQESENSNWLNQVKTWLKDYPVVQNKYFERKESVNPYVFVKYLSDYMQEGDILVHEAGGNCVVTSQVFEPKNNQRVFSNNGNSSLGYALPAAIGAAIAAKRKVNCIVGDGGINFNIQEFQTLKHHKLPVKVFIFNNQAFGITKAYRDTHFKSNYAGVDAKHGVSFPDFLKVAKAYDLESIRINNHQDLAVKLSLALEANEPIICDINMVGFYDYRPKLGWSSPIEDQYPFLPRKEFRNNMIIEPLPNWGSPKYPG